MSDKKHIDRLFQEKFKDFEKKPKANVWANIENEIKQPKRKTVLIPFWLRYTGVAALLLLFLAIGSSFFNDNSTGANTVVGTKTKDNVKNNNNDDTKNVSTSNNDIDDKNSENTNNANSVVYNNDNNSNSKSTETSKTSNKNISEAKQNKNEVIANTRSTKKKASKTYVNKNLVSDKGDNDAIISNYKNPTLVKNQNGKTKVSSNKIIDDKANVVSNTTVANNTNTSTENSTSEKSLLNNQTNKPSNSIIANNDVTQNKSNTEIEITNPVDALNATKNDAVTSTNTSEENNKSVDSTNTSNTIENAIAKMEDLVEKEKEENVNRWTVNANVAPVYYNTLGKGSHIDDQFIDNPKNGEINTSYGIKVGYNVNNKLKVRSGVNKLNLSYDTANVLVYNDVSNTPNTSALRNINFVPDSNGQTFTVLSTDNLAVLQVSNLVGENLNVALSQRMSYIEVPLELEYTVIDKKLGVNIIGGASAFFLDDNEVVSEIDNQKQKIGEANNINDVSYSANIGLGIDYKFSDTFKFNLEPTFKYQMNAYSQTSGNFKPYIIGVYTGFSYKF